MDHSTANSAILALLTAGVTAISTMYIARQNRGSNTAGDDVKARSDFYVAVRQQIDGMREQINDLYRRNRECEEKHQQCEERCEALRIRLSNLETRST